MICRWLTSLLVVASLAFSLAEDAPPSCPSWSAEFNPVSNIQIGGSAGSCNSTAIEELLTLTRTILELLQNQEPCCTPSPTPDACGSNPCQNGGTCIPTNEGPEYQCTCSAGYTGATCASDIDECASNPCKNRGTCINRINGYRCECLAGYTGTNCALAPQDCADIMAAGTNVSGVYYITPDGVDGPLHVYCDMETDGGGWTVFQRREDGSVDFFLEWDDYKHGFGNVSSEHWLGNDNIHYLSTQKTCELRVDLEDFEGETRFAVYSGFSIGDEAAKYVLTVSGYSGNAGDSLWKYHSGHPFSTKDRDNDDSSFNCASTYTGAWWYANCHYSNLNGLYLYGQNDQMGKGATWYHWHGDYYSLKKTEMKIRPS